jgi:hypothetical protein
MLSPGLKRLAASPSRVMSVLPSSTSGISGWVCRGAIPFGITSTSAKTVADTVRAALSGADKLFSVSRLRPRALEDWARDNAASLH